VAGVGGVSTGRAFRERIVFPCSAIFLLAFLLGYSPDHLGLRVRLG